MSRRIAFITGITGQDGSYLAELLLEKDYEVHGMVRRTALEAPEQRLGRIRHLLAAIKLHAASLDSFASLFKIVNKIRPAECYHLAASSFVSYSFEEEFETLHANIGSTHYLLSAIHDCAPACRVYFAGTSEMFGAARETPQDESTAFIPRSIYGISKVAGFDLVRNYRARYGLHASSGILYNHESPRRSPEFVTQKIVTGAARIRAGLATELRLGNLDARRDWGHAADYVRAMWLMLQQEKPGDFVIATGVTHSVREFCQRALARAGLDGSDYVVSDDRFFRESEELELRGDALQARNVLGWSPSYDFNALVDEMTDAALAAVGETVAS
ncbi:MAG: GDP-mannose 4,6-dehydratase [Chthoniobacter sp.]|uniref:GDP-mannose 4,6-dehydratase n=1 Tax=Chthoniobacter sp. TaxID=2510640 RepID=UPI0032A87175